MAVMLHVDKDGNLAFNGVSIKLEEIVRLNAADNTLVDGKGNIIDLGALLGSGTSATIADRALLANNTLAVGNALAADVVNKFNFRDILPTAAEPIVSIATSGLEGSVLNGTIVNYNPDIIYIATVDIGTVSLNNDIISITLPDVNINTDITLSVIAIESGKLLSRTVTYTITIIDVDGAGTNDQNLINGSFITNEAINDGFIY